MASEPNSAHPLADQPPEPTEPGPTKPVAPTLHEAELEPGPSGRVQAGATIDFDRAVARRRTGQNVVVRGNDTAANQREAARIEAAAGPCVRASPHIRSAGRFALPHYQQTRRTPPGPVGHTFYETERRKARSTT
jgi:hypothetical protein